jgi:hypothetical protein
MLFQEYKVPNKIICLARWRNRKKNVKTPKAKARTFVVAYLARNIKRNMYQVYKFILSHYGGPNKGPFSKDEKKVMKICFHHQPTKAAVYASVVLDRECRRVYAKQYEAFNGKINFALSFFNTYHIEMNLF